LRELSFSRVLNPSRRGPFFASDSAHFFFPFRYLARLGFTCLRSFSLCEADGRLLVVHCSRTAVPPCKSLFFSGPATPLQCGSRICGAFIRIWKNHPSLPRPVPLLYYRSSLVFYFRRDGQDLVYGLRFFFCVLVCRFEVRLMLLLRRISRSPTALHVLRDRLQDSFRLFQWITLRFVLVAGHLFFRPLSGYCFFLTARDWLVSAV